MRKEVGNLARYWKHPPVLSLSSECLKYKESTRFEVLGYLWDERQEGELNDQTQIKRFSFEGQRHIGVDFNGKNARTHRRIRGKSPQRLNMQIRRNDSHSHRSKKPRMATLTARDIERDAALPNTQISNEFDDEC
jgi:hypothetical protein